MPNRSRLPVVQRLATLRLMMARPWRDMSVQTRLKIENVEAHMHTQVSCGTRWWWGEIEGQNCCVARDHTDRDSAMLCMKLKLSEVRRREAVTAMTQAAMRISLFKDALTLEQAAHARTRAALEQLHDETEERRIVWDQLVADKPVELVGSH